MVVPAAIPLGSSRQQPRGWQLRINSHLASANEATRWQRSNETTPTWHNWNSAQVFTARTWNNHNQTNDLFSFVQTYDHDNREQANTKNQVIMQQPSARECTFQFCMQGIEIFWSTSRWIPAMGKNGSSSPSKRHRDRKEKQHLLRNVLFLSSKPTQSSRISWRWANGMKPMKLLAWWEGIWDENGVCRLQSKTIPT